MPRRIGTPRKHYCCKIYELYGAQTNEHGQIVLHVWFVHTGRLMEINCHFFGLCKRTLQIQVIIVVKILYGVFKKLDVVLEIT